MFKKNKNMLLASIVLVLSLVVSSLTFAVDINNSYGIDKADLNDLKEINIKNINRLHMDIGGAKIYFDDNLDSIYISDDLRTDTLGSRLTISSPRKGLFNWFNDNEYIIVIGTENNFRLIDIDAGGVSLSGVLYADELNIDAGGVDMDGEYYCQEISIDGAGMDIEGYTETEYIKINGAGIDLNLDVVGLNDMSINGVGIDARLKYLDTWEGVRHISLNGVGGDLNVMVPSNDDRNLKGNLDIDTSGIIDTDVDYY